MSYKIKAEAADRGSSKAQTLLHQGVNYLYRCKHAVLPFTAHWQMGCSLYWRISYSSPRTKGSRLKIRTFHLG